jgi:hypothetical protein
MHQNLRPVWGSHKVWFAYLWAVAYSLLSCCAIAAARDGSGQLLKLSATPAWVRPLPPLTDTATAGRDTSVQVVDEQSLIATASTYVRIAVTIGTPLGVERASQLYFDYFPTHQQLQIHGIDVLRVGQRSSRFGTAKIQQLQREPELEYKVYGGMKTVSAVLEDVRIGDRIEYAYTIHGRNPVFGGKVFGRASFAGSSPVAYQRKLLIVPADRHLKITLSNRASAPVVETDGPLKLMSGKNE